MDAGCGLTEAATILGIPLDYSTAFGFWLNLPGRVWEKRAALLLRALAFANGGDPGELMYEATELIEGQGKTRHWEAVKARKMAEGLRKWGM